MSCLGEAPIGDGDGVAAGSSHAETGEIGDKGAGFPVLTSRQSLTPSPVGVPRAFVCTLSLTVQLCCGGGFVFDVHSAGRRC